MNKLNPKQIIMLLTNAFDPDPRVHQEAKSLVQHGYELTIICWDREYKAIPIGVIDGIKVERIYVRSTHGRGITQAFVLPIFWFKAFFRVITRNFDVIHCHDFDTLPLGFLAAKLRGKKLIYDAHESYVDMLSESLPIWLLKWIRHMENFLIKRIDLLITVGSLLEDEFKRRGANKTCVVGNWKSPEDFKFAPEVIAKTKKEFGIPNGKLVVSYIGHFTKERKLKELIEAVSQSQNSHLILGGDGPTRPEIEEALKEAKHITYLGYVSFAKIPLYTAASDVIAYIFDKNNPNARFSAPNKLFEALAAGKAIISGDFGEIGKIIKEEKCGLTLKNISSTDLSVMLNSLNLNGALKSYQSNALLAGENKYNWNTAEKIMLDNYNRINENRAILNTQYSIQKEWSHEPTYKSRNLYTVVHRDRLGKIFELFDKIDIGPTGKLADFGCSSGYIISLLKDKFFNNQNWDFYGFDHDEYLLRQAREKKLENTEFYNFNLNSTDNGTWNNKFDIVICLETLEHVGNYRNAFTNLYNSCKQGGKIIISIPNEKGMAGLLKYCGRKILRKNPYGEFFDKQSQAKYFWHLLSNRPIEEFRSLGKESWGLHLGFDWNRFEDFLLTNFISNNKCELIVKRKSFFNFNLIYIIEKMQSENNLANSIVKKIMKTSYI